MRPENISAKKQTGARSSRSKMAKTRSKNLMVLVIPYYSQLVRSNGGLEHIYFKLTVDSFTGEFSKPKLCVWNSKESPSLPDWLGKEGVDAILCSDNRPGFEGLFSAAGITIYWNQRGEVADMIPRWLHSLPTDSHDWQTQPFVFA